MKTTIKVLLLMFVVAFFSCQKNDVSDTTTTDLSELQLKSATLAVNDVAVESVTAETDYEIYFYGEYEQLLRGLAHVKGSKHNLLKGKGNLHYKEGQQPVVSIDTADGGYPIIITIDYGDGTETNGHRVISGIVTLEISGPKNTDGTVRTITYTNCDVDTVNIDGVCTETFNGDNTTSRMISSVSDLTFTMPDGTSIHRAGNKVKEWLAGLDTPLQRDDDQMQITGTTTIETSNGDKYVREITDPLIRLGDCSYPVQGIVVYSKNDAEVASLDYGDGTCDNLAMLTTDGASVEIELKEHAMPKAKTEGKHKGMENDNHNGMNNNGNHNGMSGGK